MSLLSNLSKKFNSDKNLVTLSVRVSIEENAILQEIADCANCTRQDVIYQLISDHAIPEWRKMKEEQDRNEVTSLTETTKGISYFLLNTNKTNSIIDHETILKEGIAAAFENDYIGKINRIQKGDVVFLYESGAGIVAHGIGSGENIDEPNPEKINHTSMRYQNLSDFKLLEKPLAAKDVKKILDKDIPFFQTLSKVKNGEILYEHIKK